MSIKINLKQTAKQSKTLNFDCSDNNNVIGNKDRINENKPKKRVDFTTSDNSNQLEYKNTDSFYEECKKYINQNKNQ